MNYIEKIVYYIPQIILGAKSLSHFEMSFHHFTSSKKFEKKNSILAKDLVPNLFERVKDLRNDIPVYQVNCNGWGFALGTNFGPKAGIVMDNSAHFDPEFYRFVLKHEIGHIYYNHCYIHQLFDSAAYAISAFAIRYLQSKLPLWAIPIALCLNIYSIYKVSEFVGRYHEKMADEFAFAYATPEELAGWRRSLKAEISVNKDLHSRYPKYFSSEGNSREDSRHPLSTVRLQWVEREMRKKQMVIEDQVEPYFENHHKFFSLGFIMQAHPNIDCLEEMEALKNQIEPQDDDQFKSVR